jgi:hypothetical protein
MAISGTHLNAQKYTAFSYETSEKELQQQQQQEIEDTTDQRKINLVQI